MVKKELFKRELFHDDYESFDDEDFKSPKKAKKETKLDDTPSPDNKLKRARGGTFKRAWTKEEDEALLDCLHGCIVTQIAQAMKEYPVLSSRKLNGCIGHWVSWRRKLETTLLGAPTVDSNGKKLLKQNAADDSA